MSKTKAFNIDFNTGNWCNDQGGFTYSYPSIIYKSEPIWELHFVDMQDGESYLPDMSDATGWRAAVDTDFYFNDPATSGMTPPPTEPLMRTLADGIDISQAASGIISVSLNSNTSGVAKAIYGKDIIRGYFELRGFDYEDKCIYDYRLNVNLRSAIDPQGGEPIPIESGGVTLTDVYAIANGAVANAGHVTSAELSTALADYALLSALDAKQDLITSSAQLDYSLLSGTPSIPTVNNSMITLTQGGVTKGSFTLNQVSGATINFDAGGGGGGDLSSYYTKTETDALLTGKADLSSLTAHTSDLTIHVTQADKDRWNALAPAIELVGSGGTMDFTGMNGDWITTPSSTTIDGNSYKIYTKTYDTSTYYLQYVYSSFQGYNMWAITTSPITTPSSWPPSTSEASLCYASSSTTDLNSVSFTAGSYEGVTPSFTIAASESYAPLSSIQYQVQGKQNSTLTSGIFIDIVSALPQNPDANTLYFIG